MVGSLFDKLYDNYLERSQKGALYHVTITVGRENDESETLELEVWARDESHAEQRAIAMARAMESERDQDIESKSFGLVLPKEHYKPKGIFRSMASPFAVWRDPVYKKSAKGIFNNNGYTAGSITKASIASLKAQAESLTKNVDEITPEYLRNALKVNIVSIFIWAGLCIIGVIFFSLAQHPGNADRFYLSWLNPFFVASFVCLSIGILAEYKAIRDYQWITKKLKSLDSETAGDSISSVNVKAVLNESAADELSQKKESDTKEDSQRASDNG